MMIHFIYILPERIDMFQQVIAENIKFKRPEKAQRTGHFLANV